MKKTIIEDWEFTITVIKQAACRMGFEAGDSFHCRYECPTGFCPKQWPLYTACVMWRVRAVIIGCWGARPNMKLSFPAQTV